MSLPKQRKPLKHSYHATISERGVDCAYFDYEARWYDSLNAIWLALARDLASVNINRDCATLRFWRKDDDQPVFEVESPTTERVFAEFKKLFGDDNGQVE